MIMSNRHKEKIDDLIKRIEDAKPSRWQLDKEIVDALKELQSHTFCGGELVRMQVHKGDKFFIMFKDKLPQEAVERIKMIWREYIGDPTAELLVLSDGAALGVFNVDLAKEHKDDPRDFGSGQ